MPRYGHIDPARDGIRFEFCWAIAGMARSYFVERSATCTAPLTELDDQPLGEGAILLKLSVRARRAAKIGAFEERFEHHVQGRAIDESSETFVKPVTEMDVV